MSGINVTLGDRSYPVVIGADLKGRLKPLIHRYLPEGRLFVIYDAQFYALYGHAIPWGGIIGRSRLSELALPSGERMKSMQTVGRIHEFLLSEQVTRQDLILAMGGGVTTDLVGFAASSVLRGTPWAAVPTTLLGMVDAAIGGKTGVNHKQGKNLIGAFWQPRFVCADVSHLATLPPRQIVAGLGEIVKYAGLIGDELIAPVRKYLDGGEFYNEKLLKRLISRSVRYKAAIVSRDEVEKQGLRMVLNFGHTFGHAIETSLGHGRLLHGEAVIPGLLAAVELSILSNPRCARRLETYRDLVCQCLKLIPRRQLDTSAIIKAMKLDKKRNAEGLRFVLLDRPGKPILRTHIEASLVRRAVTNMRSYYSAGKR